MSRTGSRLLVTFQSAAGMPSAMETILSILADSLTVALTNSKMSGKATRPPPTNQGHRGLLLGCAY